MKKIKALFIPFFIAIVFFQIAVICYQIFGYGYILKNGEILLLKTVPIDPYDPFRGRYVSLAFDDFVDKKMLESSFKDEKYAYLIYKNNGKFDEIYKVSKSIPKDTKKYLKVKIDSHSWSGGAYVSYPFSRFYMQEDLAKEADRINLSSVGALAKVRISNGKGVIEDVLIDGVSLSKYVKSR